MTAMLKRLTVTLFTTGLLGATLLYLYTFDSVEKDVCPGHPENESGKVHFTLLSCRTTYGPFTQIFGHIGSIMVNVQRDRIALNKLRQP